MASSYGPAVAGATLRHLSPSAMQVFKDCPRRYYYKYVERKPEVGTEAQAIGTKIHSDIKDYLTTGTKNLCSISLAAFPFMPHPGDDLFVEHEISGTPKFSDPTLTIGPTPVIGSIDLAHTRGFNSTEEGVFDDPANTVEVLDWKTTKDLKWAKAGAELAETIQMIVYGEYVARKFDAHFVRLSHVYMKTAGRASALKSTRLLTRGEVKDRWETIVAPLGAQIRDVIARSSAEDVEGNPKACGQFNGCPHRAYCSIGNATVQGESMGLLENFFTSDPVEVKAKELAAELPPILPPDAPASDPKLAAKPVETKAVEALVDSTAPKKTKVKRASSGEMEIFVNALPSKPFETLDTYVRDITSQIEAEYKVPDIRAAPKESVLAYGGWKGVVASIVRERPPTSAVYVAIAPNDVTEVVCETLRSTCALYVRGVR